MPSDIQGRLQVLSDTLPSAVAGDFDIETTIDRGHRRRWRRRAAIMAVGTGGGAVLLAAALVVLPPGAPGLTVLGEPSPTTFPGDGEPGPPAVVGAPILTASGGIPFAWNVTVSPGEDGQLCGHGAFGMQVEDRTGQPCFVVAGPDAVGNELFGSGGSSTNAEGQTLVWGLLDPNVTEVVVELADGSTETATVAVGGDRGDPDDRVAVWAFATESNIEARIARSEGGYEERLDLQEGMRPPSGEVGDPSELPGLEAARLAEMAELRSRMAQLEEEQAELAQRRSQAVAEGADDSVLRELEEQAAVMAAEAMAVLQQLHYLRAQAEAAGLERAPTPLNSYTVASDDTLGVAVESCGGRPEVRTLEETNDVVRLGVVAGIPPDGIDWACDSVVVGLEQPLGDRTVIDLTTGQQIEEQSSE